MKKGEEVSVVNFFVDGFNDFQRAIGTWWSSYWRKFLKTIPGKIITCIGVSLLFIYLLYWIVTVGLQNSDFQRGMKDAMSADNYEAFMQTAYYIDMQLSEYSTIFEAFKAIGFVFILLGWIATIPFELEYIIYEMG